MRVVFGRLCTAARRPPVEETSSFLKSLLASHGPNYLEKLFGPKARNNMQPLGGVDNVAIALSGQYIGGGQTGIGSVCLIRV